MDPGAALTLRCTVTIFRAKMRVLQAMKDVPLESMKQSAGAEQRGVLLRGNWLLLARLSWLIVALFSLSYFLFSLDATFAATFAYSRGVFALQGFGNTLVAVDRAILGMLCPVLWCAIGAF